MNDDRIIPRMLIHRHGEYKSHKWYRNKYGEIDMCAFNYDFHNGPICEKCGYGFCVHCEPDGWDKKPCIIDEYYCPNCGYRLIESAKFCPECGQAILQERSEGE